MNNQDEITKRITDALSICSADLMIAALDWMAGELDMEDIEIWNELKRFGFNDEAALKTMRLWFKHSKQERASGLSTQNKKGSTNE
jgi:hypothetical protein